VIGILTEAGYRPVAHKDVSFSKSTMLNLLQLQL
jgi:hypothetical protein